MHRYLKASKPLPRPKSGIMTVSETPEPGEVIDLAADSEDDDFPSPPAPDSEEFDDEGEDAIEQLTEEEFYRHTRQSSRTTVPPGHELLDFATLDGGARIVTGDNVELKDGTFLRIKHILRDRSLGYQPLAFKLRGILLKWCRHMDGMFQKNINELVATLLVPMNEENPNFIAGLETVSLSQVRCVREIIFTNTLFPTHSLRTLRCPEHWSMLKRDVDGELELDKHGIPKSVWNRAIVNEEARLVVRWASVRHFNDDGKIKREAFRRLSQAEADPGWSVSPVQLFRTYQRSLLRRERDEAEHAGLPRRISALSVSASPAPSRKRGSTVTIEDSDDDVIVVRTQPVKKRKITGERDELEEIFSPRGKEPGLPRSRVTNFQRPTYSGEVEAGPSTFNYSRLARAAQGEAAQPYPQVQKRYTMTDLFCGMGGVSEGARMAGLHVKYGVELEKHVAQTHQLNHHKDCQTLQMHVGDFLHDGKVLPVDVLHSSCPCRYWSMQHTVPGKNDEENIAASFMVMQAARKTRCRVMTFEQAPGLMWKKDNKPFWQLWINQITSMGWEVEWRVINFVNHCNPQGRRRLIVLASCPGQQLPEFPAETSGPGLRPFVTVNEAISGIGPGVSHHNPQQMRKEQRINPRNLPAADGDKVLQHIVDCKGAQALHPNGRRKFTIREAMRLQTFPDDYEIQIDSKSGKTPYGKAVAMVGDAVPPVVMKDVFTNVIKALKKTDDEISAFVVPPENAIAID
ncbi:hypothetical protein AC578_5916 [Pseudocercospora eumusae]|uniref:DNA (cytosine-5-)-methyltransferase n=1 Tax=Pseudocercospora eumusae TaxID=321146 RepID=A0A139GTX3_9PEZI|nr:hypothetical protein AC578_5916 [Pseudocercospora eumusae]